MRLLAVFWLTLILQSISSGVAIKCLDCVDVPVPEVCGTTTTCAGDSKCHTVVDRNTTQDDEDPSSDIDICLECCASGDYCNQQGCGTKVTDISQRGPYCFACPVETDMYGCRTVKQCDIGYVCSIQTASFDGMYKADCLKKTDCDASSSPASNKRTTNTLSIHLPYCCSDDYCNDILKYNIANDSISVNGGWSVWSDWSVCSTTCGTDGQQSRARSCDNPSPLNDGAPCSGNEVDSRNCTLPNCPVDGSWSIWNDWTSCSKTCGPDGQRSRSRLCNDPPPEYNGAQCQGHSVENSNCTVQGCPVDGAWSDWTVWSTCSKSCGYNGHQTRTRTCSNPAPQFNGASCYGGREENRYCMLKECTVNGGWTPWSNWSICSVTCDSGIQSRTRACTNPSPANGGSACVGDTKDDIPCVLHACPVDGHWSEWSGWLKCSHTCGSDGIQTRIRHCNNPGPALSGKPCPGHNTTRRHCHNTTSCPVDGHWSAWHTWSTCSVTCGTNGDRTRIRQCNNPAPDHGGLPCHGSGVTSEHCQPLAHLCPEEICRGFGYQYINNGHKLCLKYEAHGANFNEARHHCQLNGGDLFIVKDSLDQNALDQMIHWHLPHDEGVWIGLHGVEHGHTWQWVDPSVPFTYHHFNGDIHHAKHEECAYAWSNTVWYKDSCHEHYPYICQRHL